MVSPRIIGGVSVNAQQLFGRKWDSGDVTASYEYYHINAVHGPGRPYFTTNFTPFGYDNRDPIGVSMPGIVSTGISKDRLQSGRAGLFRQIRQSRLHQLLFHSGRHRLELRFAGPRTDGLLDDIAGQ